MKYFLQELILAITPSPVNNSITWIFLQMPWQGQKYYAQRVEWSELAFQALNIGRRCMSFLTQLNILGGTAASMTANARLLIFILRDTNEPSSFV